MGNLHQYADLVLLAVNSGQTATSAREWAEEVMARDQKTIAERKWQAPSKAPKPQKACDIGLFSDDASQLDLVEMLQQPTNEE